MKYAAGLCKKAAARSRMAKTPTATRPGIFSEAIIFTFPDSTQYLAIRKPRVRKTLNTIIKYPERYNKR